MPRRSHFMIPQNRFEKSPLSHVTTRGQEKRDISTGLGDVAGGGDAGGEGEAMSAESVTPPTERSLSQSSGGVTISSSPSLTLFIPSNPFTPSTPGATFTPSFQPSSPSFSSSGEGSSGEVFSGGGT
jgi:hypothetical protein